jgi:hypothetical protein
MEVRQELRRRFGHGEPMTPGEPIGREEWDGKIEGGGTAPRRRQSAHGVTAPQRRYFRAASHPQVAASIEDVACDLRWSTMKLETNGD